MSRTPRELRNLSERTQWLMDLAVDLYLLVEENKQCHEVLDELGIDREWNGAELALVGRIRRWGELYRRVPAQRPRRPRHPARERSGNSPPMAEEAG